MRISARDRDQRQHDIDQERRHQDVAASAHSIRLEGGEVSAEWWRKRPSSTSPGRSPLPTS